MARKWIILLFLPIVLAVIVNETSPAPSHDFQAEQCTRYCHDHGCKHLSPDSKQSWVGKLYIANINWLKHNPAGLSYQTINVLLYVILAPILIILLFWGVMRKGNG